MGERRSSTAGASPPAEAPNVLFAVVDSLRADAVFGPDAYDTPTLDSLAADGLAFEACFSQGISTGPSMTAMLTGRYPLEYGGHWYIEDDQPTFAEQFRAAGYRTGAIHSNPYVASGRNFDRGFDEVQEDVVDFEPDHHLEGTLDKVMRLVARANRLLRKTPYTPITEVNDRIEEWVDAGEDPFFLWTQYMDVHGPYLPGGEFSYYNKLRAEWLWRKAAVRDPDGVTDAQHAELRENYRKEVEFFDREFGALLDALDRRGVLEDTVVVVVGDHGDEFGEHGWYGHCNLPYDELTHVPLVVRFPEDGPVSQGQRFEEMVRCVDILPTVADYAGVGFSDAMRERLAGESLRPLVEEGRPPEFDAVVTEKKVWSGSDLRFGFRTEAWKYLYDGEDDTAELYDLEADPGETENVRDEHPEVAARFRGRLQERIERIERTSADVTIPDLEEGAGVDERLRALGYK
jgi:arylsulfatase A-like enzyme